MCCLRAFVSNLKMKAAPLGRIDNLYKGYLVCIETGNGKAHLFSLTDFQNNFFSFLFVIPRIVFRVYYFDEGDRLTLQVKKNPQTTCDKIDRRSQVFSEIKILILAHSIERIFHGVNPRNSKDAEKIFSELYILKTILKIFSKLFKRLSHATSSFQIG